MSRDEMAEMVMVVVAIVVVLVLVVFFVHRPAFGATTTVVQCWEPSIDGKTVDRGKDAIPLRYHGDCLRLMVASVVSACEQHEGEDRASCYSYFLRAGRVECKPAACQGDEL